MKKILGTLVVVALILGSSSALAAPARTSKAMEVRQAADRANEGPMFIRAAIDFLEKAQKALQSIIASRDDIDREKPRIEEEITIGPAIVKNVGGSE